MATKRSAPRRKAAPRPATRPPAEPPVARLVAPPPAPAYGAYAAPPPPPRNDDNLLAMLCHLTALFTIFAPLVIWLIKKNESRTVDAHGRAVLNFELSLLVYIVVGMVLFYVAFFATLAAGVVSSNPFAAGASLVFLPVFFLVLLGLLALKVACEITASVRASNGAFFHYPLAIPFLGRPRP